MDKTLVADGDICNAEEDETSTDDDDEAEDEAMAIDDGDDVALQELQTTVHTCSEGTNIAA